MKVKPCPHCKKVKPVDQFNRRASSKDGVQYVHQLKQKRSKSGATIDEFSCFLDRVIRWANTELGCFIAPPTVS